MRGINAYLKDQSGQFAIMFSLVATLLVFGLGISIDLSSIHSQKRKNQSLADAAVLAAVISGEKTKPDLEAIAKATVASMAGSPDEYQTRLRIIGGNTVHVEVTKTYKLAILPRSNRGFDVKAVAEAPPKGKGKLNIALVLDTTDSMDGAKLESLKDAATDLVDVFDETGDDDGGSAFADGAVMMSVVPFGRYVKLPMSMESETWLDVEAPNENCWDKLDLTASEAIGTCTENTGEGPDYICTNPVYYEHCEIIEWDGCVASRVDPWHTRAQLGPVNISGFAGGGGCGRELQVLTDDLEQVEDAIDNLYVYDETYLPSGMMWGWRTLTPDAPLVEANTDDQNERNNVMIIMTDGENTRSYGDEKDNGFAGVFHWEKDIDDANDLTSNMCEDIKADDITIYTIAFEVSDMDTQALLQNCASSPGKYYDASSAALLASAFNSIGQELAAVRLSR